MGARASQCGVRRTSGLSKNPHRLYTILHRRAIQRSQMWTQIWRPPPEEAHLFICLNPRESSRIGLLKRCTRSTQRQGYRSRHSKSKKPSSPRKRRILLPGHLNHSGIFISPNSCRSSRRRNRKRARQARSPQPEILRQLGEARKSYNVVAQRRRSASYAPLKSQRTGPIRLHQG